MSHRIFLTPSVARQYGIWLQQELSSALLDVWLEGDIFEIRPDIILLNQGDSLVPFQSFDVPRVFISDEWQVGADDCVSAYPALLIASIRSQLRQRRRSHLLDHYGDLAYQNGLMSLQNISSDPARLLVFADEEDRSLLEVQLYERHWVFDQFSITDPEGVIVKDDLEKLAALAAHPEARDVAIFFWSEDEGKIIQALNSGVEAYLMHLSQAVPRVTNHIQRKRREFLLHRHLEAILDRAAKDSLTGLYNRHCLTVQLPGLIKEVSRSSRQRLAVILLDLDRFKHINDHWGHNAGDLILQQVTEILRKGLRQDDRLYRIGGEEFLVVVPYISTIEEAYHLAQRLCQVIDENHFAFEEEVVPVTVSAGVSIYQPGEHAHHLLKRADQALYRAKRLGRNQAA